MRHLDNCGSLLLIKLFGQIHDLKFRFGIEIAGGFVRQNEARVDNQHPGNGHQLLRDHRDDIPLLIEYFLDNYSKRYNKSGLTLNQGALTKLVKHDWPGNVWELRHALERAVIMADSSVLQPSDFLFSRETREEAFVFDSLKLKDAEKHLIRKALEKYDGNISHAAAELGLTRTSLYRRMGKYGF